MIYKSIEESDDLATNVSFSGLLMSEDTLVGRQHQKSKLPRRQNTAGPLLEINQFDIIPGGDDSTLVNATNQLHYDLFASVVIDDLELADVVVLLHDAEELEEHFGGGSEEDLLFALALGVDDVAKCVSEDVYFHH